jgi:hypothetical protein
MIILRANISEESGTIQIQKNSHADGQVTAHERALLDRLLKAITREFGEYSKSIGGGPVVNTVHRRLEAELCPVQAAGQEPGAPARLEVAARARPSMSNVETGGNAS